MDACIGDRVRGLLLQMPSVMAGMKPSVKRTPHN
jgi:hypothetical protein